MQQKEGWPHSLSRSSTQPMPEPPAWLQVFSRQAGLCLCSVLPKPLALSPPTLRAEVSLSIFTVWILLSEDLQVTGSSSAPLSPSPSCEGLSPPLAASLLASLEGRAAILSAGPYTGRHGWYIFMTFKWIEEGWPFLHPKFVCICHRLLGMSYKLGVASI